MAIQRVTGRMLESNLVRDHDLAFETDLLYLDVTNGRLGVKTTSPGNFALDVNGNTRITGDLTVQGTTTTVDSQNLAVEDNLIVINSSGSVGHNSGMMINRGSEGNNAVMIWDESTDKFLFGTTTSDGSTTADFAVTLSKVQIGEPLADADATTKKYVDDQIATVSSGGTVTLGTPSDSTFGDGAYLGLTSSQTMTDAIDDLNETMENIRNGTYVKSVTFTADSTSISLGDTVTLTITTTPTADANIRYTITWGDGTETVATSDSTPSHTYNEASGSPMTVTVKAFDNTAVTDSSGSFATFTRSSYITVASAAPVVGYLIKSASSGGSTITFTDSGNTVYLENTTTNSVADCTYEVDWGDGTSDAIANDSAAGGASGSRLAHTYTNSPSADDSSVAGTGPGDTKYRIRLTLLSHSTAAPEQIPQSADANFEVYSTHTVKIDIADSTVRGVNEFATSGFPVTFRNGTDTLPGSNSDFSATQRYTWDFGEGAGNTLVNVGSGSPGDTGQNISNTFNLSSGEQSAGTTVTYTTQVSLATGHSSTPFTASQQIIVEPDVRANISGTAVTVSTGSDDNSLTLYDHTDLDSNVRSLTRFTNTSQNADDYFYDYYDDSSSTLAIVEDGSTAGVVGVTVDKDYTGASNGNINFRFRAHGTPDTIEQDDEETLTFVMKAVPSAPAGLSSKSITLADGAQGTNPHLCAGFDDNTTTADTLSAGDSLESTVARRYTTTTTIDTSTASNFYDGASGTLAAEINASNDGTKAFTASEGETGTFTSLVVSSNVDYDTVDSSYPQRFYLVASAKITKNLSAYTVGVNAQRLTHTATGNTNYVHVVKDDITATPTTTIGTVTESSAGSYRYISGVPYYNTGSPTLQVAGTTVANFTGQAYQDATDPHEIDPGTNQESTSGNVISNQSYTYANIDGASTMLTGGIPNADTGVSSAYTLGNISVPITSSGVRSIQTIKARSKNANGTGSYSEDTTKIQVYTSSLLTLDDEAGGITVSDSLGATFDDDAVRISGLGSLSGDTPSLFDSSNANYYTDHAWSGAVTVAGTNEAISRFGTISHFTTDLSSGYLPAGPDLATGRSGAQYFTFAFRRTTMSNFTVRLSGKVSGCFIAAPGTAIDSASSLNGWLDASTTYGGSGVPGANTGSGGNGSNGCAFTSGDRIIDNTTYSNQTFTLTLGSENATNATGNNVLVRFKLESGDSITALSIE
jgi:plastocyanin